MEGKQKRIKSIFALFKHGSHDQVANALARHNPQ